MEINVVDHKELWSTFYVLQHVFKQFCDMLLHVSKILAYFAD